MPKSTLRRDRPLPTAAILGATFGAFFLVTTAAGLVHGFMDTRSNAAWAAALSGEVGAMRTEREVRLVIYEGEHFVAYDPDTDTISSSREAPRGFEPFSGAISIELPTTLTIALAGGAATLGAKSFLVPGEALQRYRYRADRVAELRRLGRATSAIVVGVVRVVTGYYVGDWIGHRLGVSVFPPSRDDLARALRRPEVWKILAVDVYEQAASQLRARRVAIVQQVLTTRHRPVPDALISRAYACEFYAAPPSRNHIALAASSARKVHSELCPDALGVHLDGSIRSANLAAILDAVEREAEVADLVEALFSTGAPPLVDRPGSSARRPTSDSALLIEAGG